jgi:lipoprotein-anchoring transpeptidase ErfK/SrfK
MHFRSLIIMGLCAALGLAVPAYAEAASPAKSTELQKKKKVATAKEKDAKAKLTAEERAAAKAKARAEAQAKALEAKKTAMRDKAKADAQAAADAWTQRKGGKADAIAKTDTKAVAEKPVAVVGLKQDDQPRKLTAERIAAQQAASVGADVVVRSGNNGELRSADVVRRPSSGFFQVLFGDEEETTQYSMLPETRALDNALRERQAKKTFRVNPIYEPQSVAFSGYPRGTIVIDTDNHFLYLVEGMGSARRYGIAVGREGLQFKGQVAVGDKQEWPRWIPTKDMQQRDPKKYGRYKDGMPGGGQNPLGARAIYLYQGKQDTHLRIHGTIAPESIGTNASNGCFRMINDHVIDLYSRVGVGTKVVIL